MSDASEEAEERFRQAAELISKRQEQNMSKQGSATQDALRELQEQNARFREKRAREARQPTREEIQAQIDSIRASALADYKVDRELSTNGVPPRHRRDLCDVLVPRSLRDWAESMPLIRGGALVTGPPGTGKTTAGAWMLKRLYLSGEVDAGQWRSPSGRFIGAAKLFEAVFAKQSLDWYERVDLLVIDDVGVPYETEWPKAALDALIDLRWSHDRATIITTNLRAEGDESFSTRYPRVYSRLCDASGPGVVSIIRDDLRRSTAPDRRLLSADR